MDRQAWIVVTLCILGLVGWQIYVARQAPPPPRTMTVSPTPAAAMSVAPGATPSATTTPTIAPNESTPSPTPTSVTRSFVEKTVTLKNDDLELLLTNRGGGIAEA